MKRLRLIIFILGLALQAPLVCATQDSISSSYCRRLLSESNTLSRAISQLSELETISLKIVGAQNHWSKLESLQKHAVEMGINISKGELFLGLRELLAKGLIETVAPRHEKDLGFIVSDDGRIFLEHKKFQRRSAILVKKVSLKSDELNVTLSEREIESLRVLYFYYGSREVVVRGAEDGSRPIPETELLFDLSYLENLGFVKSTWDNKKRTSFFALTDKGREAITNR